MPSLVLSSLAVGILFVPYNRMNVAMWMLLNECYCNTLSSVNLPVINYRFIGLYYSFIAPLHNKYHSFKIYKINREILLPSKL